jgi:hypothetical protein
MGGVMKQPYEWYFGVASYYLDLDYTPPELDSSLNSYCVISVYSDPRGYEAGQRQAILYFYFPDRQAMMKKPALDETTLYIHYPVEALSGILRTLQESRALVCGYTEGKWAGLSYAEVARR